MSGKHYDEHGEWADTFFLYSELYNSENGYEIHLLFAVDNDLAYLTIDCSDVIGTDEREYDA